MNCTRSWSPLKDASELPDFTELAALLRLVSKPGDPFDFVLADAAIRCDFYAACLGSKEAAKHVAQRAAELARESFMADDEALGFTIAAIAWFLFITDEWIESKPSESSPSAISTVRELVESLGSEAFIRLVSSRERLLVQARADGEPLPPFNYRWLGFDDESEEPVLEPGSAILVFPHIGNATTAEGRRVEQDYHELAGRLLPLVPVPDLSRVQRTLLAESLTPPKSSLLSSTD